MMRTMRATVVGLLVLGSLVLAASAHGQGRGSHFEVTITNLTRGQTFTPVLVAAHRRGVRLFTLGQPAGAELALVAEEGDTGPLEATLLGTPGLVDVVTTGPPPAGFVPPGESRTVLVEARHGADHVSMVAMLIPTNDGFFAVNGLRVRGGGAGDEGDAADGVVTVFSPAYDAGSERNDELCASIPGPFFAECGGPGSGGQPVGGEEGYVHIHAGIHGVGDLAPGTRDWRNPVAKITVRQVRP